MLPSVKGQSKTPAIVKTFEACWQPRAILRCQALQFVVWTHSALHRSSLCVQHFENTRQTSASDSLRDLPLLTPSLFPRQTAVAPEASSDGHDDTGSFQCRYRGTRHADGPRVRAAVVAAATTSPQRIIRRCCGFASLSNVVAIRVSTDTRLLRTWKVRTSQIATFPRQSAAAEEVDDGYKQVRHDELDAHQPVAVAIIRDEVPAHEADLISVSCLGAWLCDRFCSIVRTKAFTTSVEIQTFCRE